MIDLVGTRGIDAQVFHPVGRSFVVVAGNVTRLAGQLSSRSVGGNLEILQPRHGQPQFSWREAAKPTAMRPLPSQSLRLSLEDQKPNYD